MIYTGISYFIAQWIWHQTTDLRIRCSIKNGSLLTCRLQVFWKSQRCGGPLIMQNILMNVFSAWGGIPLLWAPCGSFTLGFFFFYHFFECKSLLRSLRFSGVKLVNQIPLWSVIVDNELTSKCVEYTMPL